MRCFARSLLCRTRSSRCCPLPLSNVADAIPTAAVDRTDTAPLPAALHSLLEITSFSLTYSPFSRPPLPSTTCRRVPLATVVRRNANVTTSTTLLSWTSLTLVHRQYKARTGDTFGGLAPNSEAVALFVVLRLPTGVVGLHNGACRVTALIRPAPFTT